MRFLAWLAAHPDEFDAALAELSAELLAQLQAEAQAETRAETQAETRDERRGESTVRSRNEPEATA